ncbi:DUF3967 domain-containing protein (plasmid) [Brevibacillus laterosporus]|uniref:DUF3967 domain-containing protein n=1 Tax=Brevibacillus laterosporus TaxID=1465 RepID=A0A518V2A3_BRELA|nr:DUF3967 domain-containing protein [Brevibacillus laterosporus]
MENALKLRDERLMQSLNEIMETKKLIAVAQEQPKKNGINLEMKKAPHLSK